jgi:Ferredoxin-dependent bilin reductase
MNLITDKLQPLGNEIIAKLLKYGIPIAMQEYNNEWWTNKTFSSWSFRKASIQILNRGSVYVLHLSIFPHVDDTAPIFGFDIVATPNKITAAFCDFSVTSNPTHPLINWFKERVKDVTWKKERELPDWGKQIFSDNMIAATAVNTEEEVNKVIDIGLQSLDQYLIGVGNNTDDFNIDSVKAAQNKYCFYQKQNIFPIKMLMSYGIAEDRAKAYFSEYLYRELK